MSADISQAVFQTLLSLNLLGEAGLGSGVLITVSPAHLSDWSSRVQTLIDQGKGYPDLATIQLCHLIHQTFPK